MMTTVSEQLQQLYVTYFNRPADVGGLNYWAKVISSGGTIAQVGAAFALQPEYSAAFSAKQPDQIIDSIYLNLFGRHAEQGGLKYWGDILIAHPTLISQITTAIAAGAKSPDGTLNADGAVYHNKVLAASFFTSDLQADGNISDLLAYESGAPSALANARSYLASVTDDASLAAAEANLHHPIEVPAVPVRSGGQLGGAEGTMQIAIVGSHQLSVDINAGHASHSAQHLY